MTLIRAAAEPNTADRDFDWTGLVSKGVDVIRLPATHDSIMRPLYVGGVADILNVILTREVEDRGTGQ